MGGDPRRLVELFPAPEILVDIARDVCQHRLDAADEVDIYLRSAERWHAQDSGADLIVAGAFGRSRFQEWVLGGTTHSLLSQSRLPLLLGH